MGETTQTHIKNGLKDQKLIFIFMDEDEDQSVRVKEDTEIDFSEIIQHINSGGSIFITHRKSEANTYSRRASIKKDFKDLKEPLAILPPLNQMNTESHENWVWVGNNVTEIRQRKERRNRLVGEKEIEEFF